MLSSWGIPSETMQWRNHFFSLSEGKSGKSLRVKAETFGEILKSYQFKKTYNRINLHLQFLLRFLVRFSSSDGCERVDESRMFR
jgi:hypothetical protein